MDQDLSRQPVAPRVPRPESERPLSAEETDPDWYQTNLDSFRQMTRIADGKKLCGICEHKVRDKGWRCSKLNLSAKGPGIPVFTCPAPGPACPGFSMKPTAQRPPQPKKKGLPVPPGVKFLYFGRPKALTVEEIIKRARDEGRVLNLKNWPGAGSDKHQGVVTVAWIEPSPGTLHLGFSFCSPKDPWCKATGRDIALTRLLHPVVIPFLYSPRRTVDEVARAVMAHDFVRLSAIAPGMTMWRMIPSWTKDLAKRMWPPSPYRVKFVSKCPSHVADAIGYLMGGLNRLTGE